MAEGGEINIRLLGEDGFDKDGYDQDGYDKDGYDKDGKIFDQEEGEHFPLLLRTSTSSSRVTKRPYKPRLRTSTRKEVSFAGSRF